MPTINARIKGTRHFSPARDISDPTLPEHQHIKNLIKQAKGSELGQVELERHLFNYAFYVKDGNLYVPARVIRQALVEGAKRKYKKGKDAQAAIIVDEDATFEYVGVPYTEMFGKPEYMYRRMIPNASRSRSVAIHPRIPNWEAMVTFWFDDSIVSEHDVLTWLTNAGALVGIGGNRTMGFGKFKVVDVEVVADAMAEAA